MSDYFHRRVCAKFHSAGELLFNTDRIGINSSPRLRQAGGGSLSWMSSKRVNSRFVVDNAAFVVEHQNALPMPRECRRA